jgi:hypothetical protein
MVLLSFSHLKLSFFSQKWQFFLAGKKNILWNIYNVFQVFLKRKSCRIVCWKGVIYSCKNNKYTCVKGLGLQNKISEKNLFSKLFSNSKTEIEGILLKKHFNHWKLTTFFLIFFSWYISQNSKTLVTKTIHTNIFTYYSTPTWFFFKCVFW